MTVKVAGALLAGGRSARMGRPKAGVVVDGQTMAVRALAALSGLGVPVVVVGHAMGVDGDVRVIADARADVGPLGGVEALLASGVAEAYVVLPVDMPRVTTALLQELVAAFTGGAVVYRVVGADRLQPFPLVVAAAVLATVRARLDAGERRVVDLVAALDPVIVALDAARAGELVDVDTPDDLARLERRPRTP